MRTLNNEEKYAYHQSLVKACKDCKKCALSATRNKVVISRTLYTGETNLNAKLMLVGEAPGYHEDQSGLPFIGKAGNVLQDIIDDRNLTRYVYLANVVKCRPPENRNPNEDETLACARYLQAQVRIIQPKMIIALGKVAAQHLLESVDSMSYYIGRDHVYEDPERDLQVPLSVVYHPAMVLYKRSEPDYHEWRQRYHLMWDDAHQKFKELINE